MDLNNNFAKYPLWFWLGVIIGTLIGIIAMLQSDFCSDKCLHPEKYCRCYTITPLGEKTYYNGSPAIEPGESYIVAAANNSIKVKLK